MPSITGLIILVAFVLLLGWTSVSLSVYGQRTISMEMRDWAWKYNSVSYFGGVLFGHWWVNLQSPIAFDAKYPLILLAFYIALDLIFYFKNWDSRWYRWPVIHMVIGVTIGALFWGLKHGSAPI